MGKVRVEKDRKEIKYKSILRETEVIEDKIHKISTK